MDSDPFTLRVKRKGDGEEILGCLYQRQTQLKYYNPDFLTNEVSHSFSFIVTNSIVISRVIIRRKPHIWSSYLTSWDLCSEMVVKRKYMCAPSHRK